MTIDELITRLETATGPDRELDAAIKYVHAAHLLAAGAPAGDIRVATNGNLYDVPLEYTGSLDAAIRLVPEGWKFSVTTERHASFLPYSAYAEVMDRDWPDPPAGYGVSYDGYAETPSLALCTAALKAIKAQRAAAEPAEA